MKDDTAFSLLKQRSLGTSKSPIINWARSRDDNAESNQSSPSVSSLYVHVPFCFHKCHYCDFYSIVDRQDRQEAFVERMIRELRAQSDAASNPTLDTIFIGGGTPTLLAPHLLRDLLSNIEHAFSITPATEWTIESNPETFTEEICDVLAESGVNRISTGAQSFNTKHLKALERHHDPESVERKPRGSIVYHSISSMAFQPRPSKNGPMISNAPLNSRLIISLRTHSPTNQTPR